MFERKLCYTAQSLVLDLQYASESFSDSLHLVSFLQQSTCFYLKHTFIVGELFVFVGKQSDLALCLCNGGSLFSKGDCRGCEKENYEDCLQFCTLRLLSLFGETLLWKNLKLFTEMQHFSSNFRQLLNCFENFIIVLRF